MLTYTMDIEKRSTWFRSTPSETGRSLPFFCTEAGTFYARERFVTERSHKDAYLVFYTLGGAGIIEQGGLLPRQPAAEPRSRSFRDR